MENDRAEIGVIGRAEEAAAISALARSFRLPLSTPLARSFFVRGGL